MTTLGLRQSSQTENLPAVRSDASPSYAGSGSAEIVIATAHPYEAVRDRSPRDGDTSRGSYPASQAFARVSWTWRRGTDENNRLPRQELENPTHSAWKEIFPRSFPHPYLFEQFRYSLWRSRIVGNDHTYWNRICSLLQLRSREPTGIQS